MLICTILLYVCVLDTIYGLVTKKIAVGNWRKIIVTPKEDNLFLYIIIYGATIIFLKFPTDILLVTRPYMVSRTHTYKKIVQINLADNVLFSHVPLFITGVFIHCSWMYIYKGPSVVYFITDNVLSFNCFWWMHAQNKFNMIFKVGQSMTKFTVWSCKLARNTIISRTTTTDVTSFAFVLL
jgi:hypothetical protein